MSDTKPIVIKIPKEQINQMQANAVDGIRNLKNFGSLKYNSKLILDVCNHVERSSCVRKSKQKVNKKEIVLQIFDLAYETLDPEARANISDIIDGLHDDGKIQIEPFIKWFGKATLNWVSKKLL